MKLIFICCFNNNIYLAGLILASILHQSFFYCLVYYDSVTIMVWVGPNPINNYIEF